MPGQGYTAPARRSLQIFAFDPMIARTERRRLTLQVRNEALLPGPCSRRVHVIDYDGSARVLYEPVDLDDPAVLMNEGLTPTESDPRFHQQMVYAVTMRVIARPRTQAHVPQPAAHLPARRMHRGWRSCTRTGSRAAHPGIP